MSTFSIQLGRRLRGARRGACLKQAAAAKALGISQAQYSRYECGASALTVEQLVLLAEAFNASAEYLLDGLTP